MYSTREVAQKLSISPRTVQRLISKREITSVRVGGQRRVPEEALRAYLERHTWEMA